MSSDKSYSVKFYTRDSYNGIITAFQAEDASSILASRSSFNAVIVYRLGHQVFILGSGVRLPVAVPEFM